MANNKPKANLTGLLTPKGQAKPSILSETSVSKKEAGQKDKFTSLRLTLEAHEALRHYCYAERKNIKEVVNQAILEFCRRSR